MNTRASISMAEVHDYAASLLQRYVKVKDFGKQCTSSVIITVLFYAAARITSISDACARLCKAPSDETFRQALLATLPQWAELQRRLNRALSGDLPKGLLKRPQRIAIDTHEVPYHGQPLQERSEFRGGKSRRGTTHFHNYATAYVVRKGYRFTLAMAWFRQDDSFRDVLQRLLRQVRQCGVKVRLVLLDRGFYSAVSKWLRDVDAWIAQSNPEPKPDLELIGKALAVDPSVLNLGPRLDGRTPRQREDREDS